MKSIIPLCLGLLIAVPAQAQTGAKPNAAIKTAHTVDDGTVSRGANSVTEKQARAHIAKSGYTQVSRLKKDKDGVWRGMAQKDGATVHVGLDFKGNVTTGE
ncbi:hypothetical protein HZF05_10495 [Sphingomonas sp. CGMCC 1.13654]|uniref:PepSY domain-containing protein n=1 Tax=Sphingomonas chungangi TaxID=2683589 RepID=A0A838L5T1_9SPHN|nr:hypothetical protein [Sphingomonas chungangi]MBA2934524.1 hypothetical protein [Sphingomonas chungangi]MVW57563.1 hypothetical protein [Sphingomonas chungangi]